MFQYGCRRCGETRSLEWRARPWKSRGCCVAMLDRRAPSLPPCCNGITWACYGLGACPRHYAKSAPVRTRQMPAAKASAALCATHVTLHWGAGPCSIQLPARPRHSEAAASSSPPGAADSITPSPSPAAGGAGVALGWGSGVLSGARGAGLCHDGWQVVRVGEFHRAL